MLSHFIWFICTSALSYSNLERCRIENGILMECSRKTKKSPMFTIAFGTEYLAGRLTSQLIGLIPQQSNLLPWHEAVNDKEQWQGDQLSLSFPGLFCALWKLRFGLFSPTGRRTLWVKLGTRSLKCRFHSLYRDPRLLSPLLMNDDLPLDFIPSGKRTLRHLQRAIVLLRGFSFIAQWN